MPARAQPHRSRSLTREAARVCLGSRFSIRSAAHQINPIADAPCLLEIESICGRLHVTLKIFDSLFHAYSTHRPGIRHHPRSDDRHQAQYIFGRTRQT